MLIFLDSDLNLVYASPGNIRQGSNNANSIKVIAPITSTAAMTLSFTLPSGESLPPAHLAKSNGRFMTIDETAHTALSRFMFEGQQLNIWDLKVDSALTSQAGKLYIYIYAVFDDGTVFASEPISTYISRGQIYSIDTPQPSSEDFWADVLAALQQAGPDAEAAAASAEEAQKAAERAKETADAISADLENKVDKSALESTVKALQENIASKADKNTVAELQENIASKADKNTVAELQENIASKADKNTVAELQENIASKADKNTVAELQENIASKADKNTVNASISSINALISSINAAINERVTKTELNPLIQIHRKEDWSDGIEDDVVVLGGHTRDVEAKTIVLTDDGETVNGSLLAGYVSSQGDIDSYGNVSIYAEPTEENHATTKKYVDDAVANGASNEAVEHLERRVQNLEGLLITTKEDSSVAYKKSVPSDVAPNALVTKVGGMTYKVKNRIRNIFETSVQDLKILCDPGLGSYVIEDNTPITFEAGKYYSVDYTGALPFYNMQDGSGNAIFGINEDTKYFTNTVAVNSLRIAFEGESPEYVEGAELYSDVSVTIYEFEYVLANTEVTALESRSPTNLFNQNMVVGGYVSGAGQWMTSNAGEKSFIFKCKPNTNYTLSKPVTSVLRVGGYTTEPTNKLQGTLLINVSNATDTAVVTFNTKSNNYVAIFYLNNTEISNNANVIASMALYEGSVVPEGENLNGAIIDTFTIPVEAIKAKVNGYGVGKDRITNNYIEWREDGVWFVQTCEKDESTLTVNQLSQPIETDISDILSSDNVIKVEGAGTIIPINTNSNENAAPTTIEYVIKL